MDEYELSEEAKKYLARYMDDIELGVEKIIQTFAIEISQSLDDIFPGPFGGSTIEKRVNSKADEITSHLLTQLRNFLE